MALQHHVRPDAVGTVFAGGDIEATARARTYFSGYAPSSPSVAILKNGELVYMMERRQIENQSAEMISRQLIEAFERHCPAGVESGRDN
jgi:putative YphP/YqiW family bacilliredoxin